jgi:surface polysaccharide O-acyltransferase-like enzyme
LNPENGKLSLPVDLIRTFAIVLVITLHAAREPIQIADEMSPQGVTLWWIVNIYTSLSRAGCPLFVMLTGALLLQPTKAGEPLKVFFKKRLNRIALPFLFWGAAYFAWRFFVYGEALSADSIFQDLLTSPYLHFWFLYMLAGLYLITPVLRLVIAHADQKILQYILVVWFLGVAIMPLFGLFAGYSLNSMVFLVPVWIGYYIMGAYALKVRVCPSALYVLWAWGLAITVLGTYFVVGTIGQRVNQFFYEYSSFSMIAVSVALFLLLASVPSKVVENRFPRGNRVLHLISENTLFIFLFHVMVLEALQKGFFGFQISLATMNPFLEVPLLTALTLLICLAVIYPLKKIPLVKKIIG